MRIDPDTCRDADLLAAEVRRLRAVIASAPLALTDAEREAVVKAWHGLLKLAAFEKHLIDEHLADAGTLNALLERTKNG